MAKKSVSREQLCELLLNEARKTPGLESVSAVNVHALADDKRENGANWSLADFNPGHADMASAEAALADIAPWMQREYALADE